MAPPPRPAATVALLRPGAHGPEVLLARRPPTMAFGPGLHVFPGGAVDEADAEGALVRRSVLDPAACAAAWAGDMEPGAAAATAVAAIRELFEEAGVLLASRSDGAPADAGAVARAHAAREPLTSLAARLDLLLRTDLLVPLSRWVTPPVGLARRYDARFLVAELPVGVAASPDGREVVALDWMTPHAALASMAAGRIELWPPTATTLVQLAPARDLDDVVRDCRPMRPAVPPSLERLGPALARMRLHGAGGIPGASVNAYLVGRRRVVVVDPGDPNDAAVEALLAAVEPGARVVAVLLTAPVPDHAAGSTSVALRVDARIMAADGASPYLAGGAEPLADGTVLDLADVPIRVHATPGTHPHHVALEVAEAGAVLVGDLDGGGPGRGIPEPVDERSLARSRRGIAGLRGLARLPAHDDRDETT